MNDEPHDTTLVFNSLQSNSNFLDPWKCIMIQSQYYSFPYTPDTFSCGLLVLVYHDSSETKTPAIPIPVPTHILVTATFCFLRFNSDKTVTTCLVPVQPRGCLGGVMSVTRIDTKKVERTQY